jgi:hypothetical protein
MNSLKTTKELLASAPHIGAMLDLRPFVDPVADLGLHGLDSDGDSFFIVSYVTDGAQKFTVLFHLMIVAKSALPPMAQLAFSVLDETTKDKEKQYFSHEIDSLWMSGLVVSPDPSKVDIAISGGHLVASIDQINTTLDWPGNLDTPALKFNFVMKPRGPALPNLLTGVIPFTDGIDYQYALPNMETTGEMTVRGKTYHLSGRSWLDREWGKFGPCKWTWMNIQLGDDKKEDLVHISLWDEQSNDNTPKDHTGGPRHFATILNPDGSLIVDNVIITEKDHGTSPKSQKTYATKWHVEIPGKANLTVQLLVENQEIQSPINANRIEGKAHVTGTYDGKSTSGVTTVEMYDLFPLFVR